MESSIRSSENKTVAAINQSKGFQGIRLQNPFTLKVGQVFSGFGIGCGVGIGVGRPLNLVVKMKWDALFCPKNDDNSSNLLPKETCAIPMVGQVMIATRGATEAFSGVGRHVNSALWKLGAKNIQAGVGCGVGLGHGFGVGLAVKPGMVHQIQCSIMETMANLMMKFGMASNSPFNEGAFHAALQSGLTTTNESSQNPFGNMKHIVSKLADPTSQDLPGPGIMSRGSASEKNSPKSPIDASFGTRTEKVLHSFLQNPVLKEGGTVLNELAGKLQTENNMLQLVLKNQQIIEELMEENQKLHQILMEDLKIPPSKFQTSYSSKMKPPCSECFHCRRKERRNRQ